MYTNLPHLQMRCAVLLFLYFLLPIPTLHAGAWTLPKGHFWAKITGMTQSTQEEYVAVGGSGREPNLSRQYQPGDRAPYRENGHYQSHAIFLDLFYGITHKLDMGIQIPFFRQTFENVGFRPANTASGFSDMRLFTKLNLLQKPIVTTLKWGVKAPTGKFETQDGLIPVGEGQWDFDWIAQLGHSFWPLPLYTHLEVGYRLRLKNDTINRDPGNEWIYHAEVGYHPASKLLLALKIEGIYGQPSRIFNIELPRDVKRITYISPTVLIGPYHNFNFETTLRISAGGQNFPAGHMWVGGISYSGNIICHQNP